MRNQQLRNQSIGRAGQWRWRWSGRWRHFKRHFNVLKQILRPRRLAHIAEQNDNITLSLRVGQHSRLQHSRGHRLLSRRKEYSNTMKKTFQFFSLFVKQSVTVKKLNLSRRAHTLSQMTHNSPRTACCRAIRGGVKSTSTRNT